jgi:hypothetical protein
MITLPRLTDIQQDALQPDTCKTCFRSVPADYRTVEVHGPFVSVKVHFVGHHCECSSVWSTPSQREFNAGAYAKGYQVAHRL